MAKKRECRLDSIICRLDFDLEFFFCLLDFLILELYN